MRATAPVDSASYARTVREDTAELASYVLSDKKDKQNASFLQRGRSSSSPPPSSRPQELNGADDPAGTSSETIPEVSEPPTPEETDAEFPNDGPSILSTMLKSSPPKTDDDPLLPDHSGPTKRASSAASTVRPSQPPLARGHGGPGDLTEQTPLLRAKSNGPRPPPESPASSDLDDLSDIESQKPNSQSWNRRYGSIRQVATDKLRGAAQVMNPKTWDRRTVWRHAVKEPASYLPAVLVGLLLNILDALSYGGIPETYPAAAGVRADTAQA